MTCQEVQRNLSLYLYGELDFAGEEALECHLAGCSLCQLALGREKSWHSSLNAERQDVPLDLLSQARRDLRIALQSDGVPKPRFPWWHRLEPVRLASLRWSPRLAFASLFLFLGFTGGRWIDRFPLLSVPTGGMEQAGLGPEFSRVRTVQAGDNDRVRILVDQIQRRELVGSINDADIRELLLQGSKDPADPGLRVDSVELLKGHDGADIRDALLFSVTHDDNAAVRLKALEGLRRFSSDHDTRETLRKVLEQDASPAVRTEAIDVLVPKNGTGRLSPDLANTLQTVIQSEPSDDYLRARCLQILSAGRSGLY